MGTNRSSMVSGGTLAWSSQDFTANGNFTTPSDVPLNAAGEVDLYVSGIAGGAGGGGMPTYTAGNWTQGQGGQSGDWCFRRKISVPRGTVVPVTIGTKGTGGAATPAAGTNGSATSFGAYLSLSGGVGGAVGIDGTATDRGYNPSNGNAIISGTVALDTAVHEGAAGGRGNYSDGNVHPAYAGMSNPILDGYVGNPGDAGNGAHGGGGGVGINGAPGTANSGAGGRGGQGFAGGAGVDGCDGWLRVEWRIRTS